MICRDQSMNREHPNTSLVLDQCVRNLSFPWQRRELFFVASLPLRLHDVVLNQLSKGPTLPLPPRKRTAFVRVDRPCFTNSCLR